MMHGQQNVKLYVSISLRGQGRN